VDLHGRMFKQLEAEDRRDSEIKKARSDWVSIIVAVFALVISLKATYDASRSADIAAESLKVQEKAMEASQRPFIGVENPSIRSGKAVLQLRVYGNAPAKVVSISTSCESTHFPPRAEDGGGDLQRATTKGKCLTRGAFVWSVVSRKMGRLRFCPAASRSKVKFDIGIPSGSSIERRNASSHYLVQQRSNRAA
jgi:hypothetical protein